MKGKFDITGRTSQTPTEAVVDRFVSGEEPMTTMTFQLPVRLQRALKREALDRDTTVKALLIDLIEGHLVTSKQ